MRFRIQFDDGALVGTTENPADAALIEQLIDATERGDHHLTVGLPGDRVRTVGDIRSIETISGGVMTVLDAYVGSFHNNSTLCTACHPGDCHAANCCWFFANDVTEGHVGACCDGCGKQLLDACGRPS